MNVIDFIHFRARFSLREGRGGCSPRRAWNTSRSTGISDNSVQLDLPRQSFVGHNGHRAEPIYLCSLNSEEKGSTFRALRISQLRTLSQSVTIWDLRKNSISCSCPWDIISVITQDSGSQVRIGTKADLKTDSFAMFESFRFVTRDRWSSRRTAFALSIHPPPCSTFRHW